MAVRIKRLLRAFRRHLPHSLSVCDELGEPPSNRRLCTLPVWYVVATHAFLEKHTAVPPDNA